MLPFFVVAMQSPGRHRSFRRAAMGHFLIVSALIGLSIRAGSSGPPGLAGYLTLMLGMIEGAALIGWRLAQLPKSQALEFLIVTPLRPRRIFLAEAAVGIARFLLVQMTTLPVFSLAVLFGQLDESDLIPLAVMPVMWGITTGLLLTAWVYEPLPVRHVGELVGLIGVLVYLVVGLLAGEHLKSWLEALPGWLGQLVFDGVMLAHTGNPFGVVHYWLDPTRVMAVAWERFAVLHAIVAVVVVAAAWRAASRLQGHYRDRHYSPQTTNRANDLLPIGDRPLSWWAVRRVMEYSGRVNLWLAGGVAVLYALRIMAGDHWPPKLGNLVFVIFEQWGGPAGMATILCVLATVPASFQYGLWDATASDRCKRLELMLLTELDGRDFAHAAAAAAWRRGRGYFFAAAILWLSLGLSSRNAWSGVLAAALGGALLWGLLFAIGFQSFAKGRQTNGLATLMTIGLPVVLVLVYRSGYGEWAGLIPTGWCYVPLRSGWDTPWFTGMACGTLFTSVLLSAGIRDCKRHLQNWYDQHHSQLRVE
jgi:hypothetical protein